MLLGLNSFFFRESWRVFSTKKTTWGPQIVGLRIREFLQNGFNLGLGIIEYFLAGGNSNIFGIFIPRIGDDISNLTHIFFKWVETTN